MPHSTAFASFSSCEYLVSVSVIVLEREVMGLHRLAWGSYCSSVTAKPWGPASVLSLVSQCGSNYAITVSPGSSGLVCSNALWHSGVHCKGAPCLMRSLSGAVICAKLSMKSALAPAKKRNDRTSA